MMTRSATLISISLFFVFTTKAQVVDSFATAQSVAVSSMYTPPAKSSTNNSEKVYTIKPWLDIPLAAATTAWTLYGFSVIYGRDSVPVSELNALDRNNINNFDRGTTSNYSLKAKSASDVFFYGSMPLPLVLMLDKKMRKDAARIGLLYLETIGVTGTIYTVAAMSANRFRPYAYNPDVPLAARTRGGARNSFFAGHVAVVGTSTFFMASMYTHYHPELKNKWIFYSIAGAATVTTAILRVKAGQHFPTDVIVGSLLGPTVGILVPHFHKNKALNQHLSFYPQIGNGSTGFTALYKF